MNVQTVSSKSLIAAGGRRHEGSDAVDGAQQQLDADLVVEAAPRDGDKDEEGLRNNNNNNNNNNNHATTTNNNNK